MPSKSTSPATDSDAQPEPTLTEKVATVIAAPPAMTLEYLVSLIDSVKAIDSVIGEKVGTIGEVTRKARAELLPEAVDPDILTALSAKLNEVKTYSDLQSVAEAVKSFVHDTLDSQTTLKGGDVIVSHRATVDTLTEQRTVLVTRIGALHTLHTQMVTPGIDKVVIPSGGPKTTSSDSPKVSTSGLSFYIDNNGTRTFYTKGSPLSLVALRYFGGSAGDLKSALEAAGVNIGATFPPVSITVGNKTGMVGACDRTEWVDPSAK